MGTLGTILSEIEHVLSEVDETKIDTFAEQLLAPPRVFVTGEGRSGLMAKAFAMRMMHLGLTVYVVGETTTPALTGKDALVAVSGSGTTEGTVQVVQQAKGAGCTVFVVTANPDSPLAALAAHTLIIPAATKWRRTGESATAQPLGSLFDQCCHITLDAVCLHIAERKGISNEIARQRHTNVE
jgi:6-phospho-3-hexuloisomerase